ncbi:MAG TPA: BMP family ABC transporter substrate-binding protein [Candidatus Limnocylindria bacterium]|jgi:basic membrane protein A|nr:BMP family ABC transporter substrate-binding protein [Candidatus Limnocylindria bacterium]
MRKRNYAFSAMFVSLALVLGACSGGQISTGAGLCREVGDAVAAEPSTPESTGTSDLVIGLVTDVGTLDDAGFNQYSWEGALQGAAIIGAPEPEAIVSTDSSQYEDNINSFVDAGANLIVTVGFAAGAATQAAATENPDIHFVGVDQFQVNTDFGGEWEPLPNYESLIFSEQQAGYLAGILAGSISESGEVAALGGSGTIPPVVNYMRGFENGVHSVNADATVHLKYVSNDLTTAFNDPTTGKTFADEFLAVNENVDLLFAVAGKTGNGMLDSVVEHGIYGFGVDVDQWVSLPDAAICIVTSAEKHLTLGVSESITSFAAGDVRSNNVFYGADNNGIGLAPYYQFSDLVTDDIQAAIDDAFDAMASGDLNPCGDPSTCYAGEEDPGT